MIDSSEFSFVKHTLNSILDSVETADLPILPSFRWALDVTLTFDSLICEGCPPIFWFKFSWSKFSTPFVNAIIKSGSQVSVLMDSFNWRRVFIVFSRFLRRCFSKTESCFKSRRIILLSEFTMISRILWKQFYFRNRGRSIEFMLLNGFPEFVSFFQSLRILSFKVPGKRRFSIKKRCGIMPATFLPEIIKTVLVLDKRISMPPSQFSCIIAIFRIAIIYWDGRKRTILLVLFGVVFWQISSGIPATVPAEIIKNSFPIDCIFLSNPLNLFVVAGSSQGIVRRSQYLNLPSVVVVFFEVTSFRRSCPDRNVFDFTIVKPRG